MSTPTLKLSRNLRRNVLRGHPWIYKNALEPCPPLPIASIAKINDSKGEFLCWGMYDPHSPIAVRVLSTTDTFSQDLIAKRVRKALAMRTSFLSDYTTTYRLLNGEGDLLPGIVCDIYGPSAVIQYDGQGPMEFWQNFPMARIIMEISGVESVFIKPRGEKMGQFKRLVGKTHQILPLVKENNCQFKVDIEEGQKTGFFLDQRENRKYVSTLAKGKTVANFFSYTGGFSVYAGRGKATKVLSVDLSPKAMTMANENWALNKLAPENHETLTANVFEYLTEEQKKWDIVIVDPPSMAHSEDQKESAITKYTNLFSLAAKRVQPGGDLLLSSCSSHINFNDFYEICTEAVSKARRTAQIQRISGQSPDHPFPLACPELRYLKFFHLKLS